MNQYSLLSMSDLSDDDIFSILHDAKLFDNSMKDWQLPMHNALVANLFLKIQHGPISHLKAPNYNSAAKWLILMPKHPAYKKVKASMIRSKPLK